MIGVNAIWLFLQNRLSMPLFFCESWLKVVLGDAPAHSLFDLVEVKQKYPAATARAFSDFAVSTPAAGPLAGFPRVAPERIVG